MLKTLIQWCPRASRLLAWIGGAALMLSAICISLDVVFRAVWKITFFESFELSGYAFAIATSTGMAFALVTRAHIRIELLYAKLPIAARAWMDVWAFAGLAVVASVLVYWSSQMFLGNWQSGARSNSSLAVPLMWPQALWLIGLTWMALVALVYAIFGFTRCVTGRYDEAHSLLGVGTLDEEIAAGTAREMR